MTLTVNDQYSLHFRADLVWHCRDEGDANNHYNIRPCAPDKLPELPPGQVRSTDLKNNMDNATNFSLQYDLTKISNVHIR